MVYLPGVLSQEGAWGEYTYLAERKIMFCGETYEKITV